MKPSKIRLKRRQQQQRLHEAGAALEEAARKARHELYQAALVFASEVYGEAPTQPVHAALKVAK